MLALRPFYHSIHGCLTTNTGNAVKTALLHHVRSKRLMTPQNGLRYARSRAEQHSIIRKSSLQPSPVECNLPDGPIPRSNIYKAFLFTSAFGVGCFLGATVLEYENTRNMMLERARQTKFFWSRHRMQAENTLESWKRKLKQGWQELSAAQKVYVPICALNLVAFGLWRLPSWRPVMLTYFCSNPAAKVVCWPMFLSTFSHYSPLHLFANMYVLYSFCIPAVPAMGMEQFTAVYLTAGVFASFCSCLHKFITAQSGLSLGASGAIMAVLAYVCTTYPETQLSVLFLPMYTFSAGTAIKFIMGLDIAGCILGWKFFDHAAHLGGALFGLFWAHFGRDVWQQRIPFLTMYHDWRKTK